MSGSTAVATLWRRAGPVVAYSALAAATTAVLCAGMRLDRVDLSAPFAYDSDALLILPLVKSFVETGTHWHNDRLGAPGVQELYDFPVIDHLHFAVLWAIGRFTPDAVVAFNLYYLATYPLTAVTTAVVLRNLGASAPAAAAGGTVYAFLPYHALRGEDHYFLSAYYVVPFSVLLMVWVCQGRLPYFRRVPPGGYRLALGSRDALTATGISLAVASSGAYYAFFSCALLVAAGAYGWSKTGDRRAAVSAWAVIAVTVAGGLTHHLPAFAFQRDHGKNAAYARVPAEAEHHGLKLAHLLLPVPGHQSRTLAAVQAAYATPDRPLQHENTFGSLGIVGSSGLMILLAAAVLPRRHAPLIGPLLSLTIFAILLGTIGGFGSIFNLLVSPEVRAYNRISLFIALFAIITVVHQIDRLVKRDIARWPLFVLLAAFGVWDQSPRPWFRPQIAAGRERVAARYHADAAFFRGVEQAMPGASLFTLPYVRYPEDYDTPLPGGYEHARGYLHTRTLRFSFGAIRRREADQWARATSAQPPRELIRRLALRGFDGIFLDRRGFAPGQAAEFVAAVGAAAAVAVPTIDHPDGNQSVLDLRPYRERLRLELGAEFDTLRRRDEDAVRVLWLSGFRDDEESERRRHRWCDARGEVSLVNPTDRPRRVQLTMAFGTGTPESSDLTIEGGVWSDRFPVSSTPVPKRWDLVVPPGRHRVAFRCRPGGTDRPGAVPGQVFFVALFEIVEAPEREGS